MIAHDVVDALRGKGPWGVVGPAQLTSDYMAELARLIDLAEKVDFGPLDLERDEAYAGAWNVPTVTQEERSFWRDGLIVLPAPLSWFEFVVDGFRSGALVHDTGSEWKIIRFDRVRNELAVDGMEITIERSDQPGDGGMSICMRGAMMGFFEKNPEAAKRHAALAPLCIYLALMLNSKTSDRTRVRAPAPLNKKRARNGKAPLYDHTVVVITPKRFRDYGDGQGGTHASPRLHWRRSHLRHYDRQTAGGKWVAEHEHQGQRGWWLAVIPRCLVGRADLGEVTHEYKVLLSDNRPEAIA